MNLYGYADGDPINNSDPFGLCPGWLSNEYDADCDYDGDGANSRSEKAAHNVAGSSSGVATVFWNVLGVLNAAAEDRAGGALIQVLATRAGGRTAAGRATDRYGKALGPSGRPMVHNVRHNTNKAASDAARHAGNGKPVKHASPAKGRGHYHATKDGKRVPNSVHHEYPNQF